MAEDHRFILNRPALKPKANGFSPATYAEGTIGIDTESAETSGNNLVVWLNVFLVGFSFGYDDGKFNPHSINDYVLHCGNILRQPLAFVNIRKDIKINIGRT